MKEYLDIREINGYSIQYTPFHTHNNNLDSDQKQDMSATFQTITPAPDAALTNIPHPIKCLVCT